MRFSFRPAVNPHRRHLDITSQNTRRPQRRNIRRNSNHLILEFRPPRRPTHTRRRQRHPLRQRRLRRSNRRRAIFLMASLYQANPDLSRALTLRIKVMWMFAAFRPAQRFGIRTRTRFFSFLNCCELAAERVQTASANLVFDWPALDIPGQFWIILATCDKYLRRGR